MLLPPAPLLLLSLLASFLLLLPSPLLLTPLLVGPGWGWIPTKLSATSTPICLSPTPPQAPDQPQRDVPHAGPEGPQPLIGLGWGPGRPPLSPTVPTAASLSASCCDETSIPPLSADVFFAVSGVEDSIYTPPHSRLTIIQQTTFHTCLNNPPLPPLG